MYNKIKNCLTAMGHVITECEKLEREDGFRLGSGISMILAGTSVYITYIPEDDEIWVYDMTNSKIRFIITSNTDYIMLFNLGAAIENITIC